MQKNTTVVMREKLMKCYHTQRRIAIRYEKHLIHLNLCFLFCEPNIYIIVYMIYVNICKYIYYIVRYNFQI